ncbi:hypothetical protein bcgnr5373_59100 [Bacillus cereus]
MVVEPAKYYEVMELLRFHEGLAFDYMSEFFRNKERWQTLESKALPKLLEQNNGKLKVIPEYINE